MIRDTRRRAFSVIELLVVIAIVGITVSLIMAAVQVTRQSAYRSECASRLRQMGLALHHYHDARGSLPSGCSYHEGSDPQPHMSWMTRLLPYLEEQPLWDSALAAFGKDAFFEGLPHRPVLARVLPVFTCPADPRTQAPAKLPKFDVGLTSYLGVAGADRQSEDGVLYLDSEVRFVDIRDGTSNTLAVGERPPSADLEFGWWYAGWGQKKDGSADSFLGVRDKNVYTYTFQICPDGPYHFHAGRIAEQCDMFHFWSPHSGGAHFLFADGAVRFLRYDADHVLPALASRSGGELVSVPE
jgi:prepilin-type N-terminal cleavage/methylation domain-containing protein/prepilin-type processing-associated H-X9-DG protein